MRHTARALLLSAALLLTSCGSGSSGSETSSAEDTGFIEFVSAPDPEPSSSEPEEQLDVSCQVTLNNANGGEISSGMPGDNARILYEMITAAADKPISDDVSGQEVLRAVFTANGEEHTLTLFGSDTFGWQSSGRDTVYFRPDSSTGDRLYSELSAYCALGTIFPGEEMTLDPAPFESDMYKKVKPNKKQFFEQQSHFINEDESLCTLISHSGDSNYFCTYTEFTKDMTADDPDSYEVFTDGITAYERTGTDEEFSSFPADEVLFAYPYFADNVKYFDYNYSFSFRKQDETYTVECLRSAGERQYLVFNMQKNPCGGWNISDNGADIMTYYFMSEAPVNFDELFAGVK